MKLVIDTNIIISALLKDSVSRNLIFTSRINFYTPDISLKEVLKYKGYIKKKGGLDEKELDELFSLILKYIITIPLSLYSKNIKNAENIIGGIDEKDIPYIALALSLNTGIWSDDKHFKKQNKIKVYTTSELLSFIKKF